ncbi:hypothetical protein MYAM1_000371 [Malassezia yamatoensis]|uniref:TLC domain-containing protein n=1 Tax=Malassezia yamatoensis TaxID=253288 RepID=A0AAJ5YPZ3_9BASI|nr:hypothetical protein MYAM1_000371 [Malassezia yamatoensis]
MAPVEWLLQNQHANHLFLSLGVIQSVYQVFARTLFAGDTPDQLRKRSWIITTFSALVVSTVSIPYVFDFFYTGMDWQSMSPHRETISDPICLFFVAYLLSDLGTGFLCYRSLVNFSSGWVHHTVYAILCVCLVYNHWSHAFALAAIMEMPTWIMGIGVMNPRLRSYWAFTLSFLATRIVMHILLVYSLAIPSGRYVDQYKPSWWPLTCAVVAFPMHVVWAYKSIRGLYRRHLKRKIEAEKRDLERRAAIDEATKLLDSADVLEEYDAIEQPGRNARARRLVSNAVYKLWYSAPEAWRNAYAEELESCKEQGVDLSQMRRSTLVRQALARLLLQRDKRGHNLPLIEEDDEDDLEDWMSVTSMSGLNPPLRKSSQEARTITLGKGITIKMPRELDPIIHGQKYVVSEFPVDQTASGTRRQRILGQMRRRFEIARRDMVVF